MLSYFAGVWKVRLKEPPADRLRETLSASSQGAPSRLPERTGLMDGQAIDAWRKGELKDELFVLR